MCGPHGLLALAKLGVANCYSEGNFQLATCRMQSRFLCIGCIELIQLSRSSSHYTCTFVHIFFFLLYFCSHYIFFTKVLSTEVCLSTWSHNSLTDTGTSRDITYPGRGVSSGRGYCGAYEWHHSRAWRVCSHCGLW